MGSRVMHAIVGYQLAKALSIKDKTSFLLGNIAPDAVSSHEEKNASHFMIGKAEDYSRRADFTGFLHKYKSEVEKQNPYILGYAAHLVTDDVWLLGFYQSWLKNRMEADEGLHELYHQDFRMLNGKLLEYYGLRETLVQAFNDFVPIMDLDEVPAKNVEKFVPYVIGDTDYDQDVLDKELQVFTFQQIIGYLETSVDVAAFHLKGLVE